MPTIHIGFNKSVNPCVLTPTGEFAPEAHSIYISCASKTCPELYHRHGWYIGTVWLGNPNLTSVGRAELSSIMTEISNIVDPVIEGDLSDLYSIMIERLKMVADEMTTRLPKECSPIELTKYNYSGGTLEAIKNKLELNDAKIVEW
jgi:hypothetical protein